MASDNKTVSKIAPELKAKPPPPSNDVQRVVLVDPKPIVIEHRQVEIKWHLIIGSICVMITTIAIALIQ